jgi:hypothetical protein
MCQDAAMRIDAQITYPDATVDQAFGLIVDPEFRAAVCDATKALDYEVEVDEHDDGSASVRVHRVLPAEVPDFVKKLVGTTIDAVQYEEWGVPDAAGRRTADLRLEIKGQPAKMTGTVTLEADGVGVTEHISGDLKVSIPLLGKKIEPEIAKGVLLAIKVEQKLGRTWLAG